MSMAKSTPPALVDRLRDVELFADLDAAQLQWLAEAGRPLRLADGAVLFSDGELGRHFYVLLVGELLITKVVDGREEVFGRHVADVTTVAPERDGKPRAAHQFTGELPMLAGGGYVAKAVAVGDTELLSYERDVFFQMLARCPQVCRILLPVLAWRIHSYEEKIGRRSMLEGLGTLAAGLAHELNNPTAALLRTASELRDAMGSLTGHTAAWAELATVEERATVAALRATVGGAGPLPAVDNVLATADAEDLARDWLTGHGMAADTDLAAILAEQGFLGPALDQLADRLRPAVLPAAVGYLCFALYTETLLTDITEAGQRIEALVRSAKAYSNLDRAPQQDVDVHGGLDATLAMLAAKLRGITVHRDYADLGQVRGYPGELNQVWTNLIDNAVDAMGGVGQLWLSTRTESADIVVEIRDDGPGVPSDALPWLFQPFFTTKDIGKGTGLGLHLCRDVITQRHDGTIEVCSTPGDTRFTVRLPATGR
jgi:signal transduction histidine kinase